MVNGRIEALGSVQALREQRDLPLQITLSLEPAALAGAAAALQPLLAAWPRLQWQPSPGGLLLHCPRAAKMAVLQALLPLGAGLADVQVAEPSLADLFFSPHAQADAA